MDKFIDLISRMRKLSGSLPKSEQQVADFILGNLDRISFLSQQEIAEAASVSVATVNRFSVAMGCDGFRDFKIRLAQSVAISQQYFRSGEGDDSPSSHLVSQVFESLTDTLALARAQLDGQPIEEVIVRLNAAKRIAFFGVGGNSSNVAKEAANRFFRLGIAAEAHADGYLQRMIASSLSEEDIVFAISSTGQPAELLDSFAIARQYGVQTISITKAGSELAAQSDIAIALDLPEDPDIFKPTASRLVYMCVVDVLAAGVAHKRPEIAREKLRRIRTSLLPLSIDLGPKPIGD